MKTPLLIAVLVGLLAISACAPAPTSTPTPIPPTPTEAPEPTATSAPFVLSSPAFENNGAIPEVHSCNGESTSPALEWTEPPAGTQAFALLMDDLDVAPGGFVHWIIFNIPAESRGLPEGVPTGAKLPDGSEQGIGGAGLGYFGPCPPTMHHYSFKLFALDAPIDSRQGAVKDTLLAAIEGHVLAESELIGTYQP